MAVKTPTQVDALDDYTNAQLLKLTRYAIARLVSDPDAAVTIGGRSYTVHSIDTLRRLEEHYAARAAEDSDGSAIDTAGCPVVTNQEAQV